MVLVVESKNRGLELNKRKVYFKRQQNMGSSGQPWSETAYVESSSCPLKRQQSAAQSRSHGSRMLDFDSSEKIFKMIQELFKTKKRATKTCIVSFAIDGSLSSVQ